MDIPAIESLQDGQYLTAYVLQSITKKESDWSNASTLVLYLRHCQGQLTSLLLQSLAPIYNLGMRKKCTSSYTSYADKPWHVQTQAEQLENVLLYRNCTMFFVLRSLSVISELVIKPSYFLFFCNL